MKCQCKKCGKVFLLRKDKTFSLWALKHVKECNSKLIIHNNNYDDLFLEIQSLKTMIKAIPKTPITHLHPPNLHPPKSPIEDPNILKQKKALGESIRLMSTKFKELGNDFEQIRKSLLAPVPKEALERKRPKTDQLSFARFKVEIDGKEVEIEDVKN